MSRFPHLGPTHRLLPSWALIGVIVAGCCGCLLSGAVSFALSPGPRPPFEMVALYSLAAVVSATFMLVERLAKARESARWLDEARYHNLNFAERPAEADLEPFLDSPLFRFGALRRANAYSHTWGSIAGRAFSVLNYRYAGRRRVGRFRTASFFYEQTVALFPGVGLPDFHLAPSANDWAQLNHHWAELLAVGEVIRVVNPLSNDPSDLRARDAAPVLALFDSRRISRRLAKLAGWTVESRNGHLVIYFHGDRRKYGELPAFILKASRLVEALCRPAPEVPPSDDSEPDDSPATDGRIRPAGPG